MLADAWTGRWVMACWRREEHEEKREEEAGGKRSKNRVYAGGWKQAREEEDRIFWFIFWEELYQAQVWPIFLVHFFLSYCLFMCFFVCLTFIRCLEVFALLISHSFGLHLRLLCTWFHMDWINLLSHYPWLCFKSIPLIFAWLLHGHFHTHLSC